MRGLCMGMCVGAFEVMEVFGMTVGCVQSPCSMSGLWAQACLSVNGGAGGAWCLPGPGVREFGWGCWAMNEDACDAPGLAERRARVFGAGDV